jgi:hypothetical protein
MHSQYPDLSHPPPFNPYEFETVPDPVRTAEPDRVQTTVRGLDMNLLYDMRGSVNGERKLHPDVVSFCRYILSALDNCRYRNPHSDQNTPCEDIEGIPQYARDCRDLHCDKNAVRHAHHCRYRSGDSSYYFFGGSRGVSGRKKGDDKFAFLIIGIFLLVTSLVFLGMGAIGLWTLFACVPRTQDTNLKQIKRTCKSMVENYAGSSGDPVVDKLCTLFASWTILRKQLAINAVIQLCGQMILLGSSLFMIATSYYWGRIDLQPYAIGTFVLGIIVLVAEWVRFHAVVGKLNLDHRRDEVQLAAEALLKSETYHKNY